MAFLAGFWITCTLALAAPTLCGELEVSMLSQEKEAWAPTSCQVETTDDPFVDYILANLRLHNMDPSGVVKHMNSGIAVRPILHAVQHLDALANRNETMAAAVAEELCQPGAISGLVPLLASDCAEIQPLAALAVTLLAQLLGSAKPVLTSRINYAIASTPGCLQGLAAGLNTL